jgi:hypothetical protein
MLHKIAIVLIAIGAIGAAAMPTDVFARGGHGGWRGGHSSGHFHGFRGGFGYRSFGYSYYAGRYGYACWRWTDTPVGPRRVWVCGPGYPYY